MQFRVKEFPEGKMIFPEGSPGDNVYIVKSGRVEVFKLINDQKIVLGELKEGEIFGEMALFLPGKTRTASVQAADFTELIEINAVDFKKTLAQAPVMIESVIKALSKRLQETSASVSTKIADLPLVSIMAIIGRLLGDKCTQPKDTNCPYCVEHNIITHDETYRAIKEVLMYKNEEINYFINKAVKMGLLKSVGKTFEINNLDDIHDATLELYSKFDPAMIPRPKQEVMFMDLAELSRTTKIPEDLLKSKIMELPAEDIIISRSKLKKWLQSMKG